MTRENKEVLSLLRDNGAILERTKKHHIYRFPDRRIFVLPASPSCVHAWKNSLKDLKEFLGLNAVRGIAHPPRPKRVKTQRPKHYHSIEAAIVPNNVRVDLEDLRTRLVSR